jgi:LysM repeat protein
MRSALFVIALLLSACMPATTSQAPAFPETLIPYHTQTPSATLETPEGLVVSFETPLPSPTPFVYEVKAGDTMGSIALRFGVTVDQIVAANPDISPNSMSIGTVLNVPSLSSAHGASTPTPVPVPVKQIECHPTVDGGTWCFVLVHNDTSNVIENLSAQVTLQDEESQTLASALALSLLNILPVNASLPLMVYFPPVNSSDDRSQAQMLTGITLEPDDARYLPATVHNTLVQIDRSGRSATVSGTVRLPEDAPPAGVVWVVAVAYDGSGRVVGARRWESNAGVAPGGGLPFSFAVFSLAGEIERVEFVVEARP